MERRRRWKRRVKTQGDGEGEGRSDNAVAWRRLRHSLSLSLSLSVCMPRREGGSGGGASFPPLFFTCAHRPSVVLSPPLSLVRARRHPPRRPFPQPSVRVCPHGKRGRRRPSTTDGEREKEDASRFLWVPPVVGFLNPSREALWKDANERPLH